VTNGPYALAQLLRGEKKIQISVVTEHRRFEPENSVPECVCIGVCVCVCVVCVSACQTMCLQHQGNMVVMEERDRVALFVCDGGERQGSVICVCL